MVRAPQAMSLDLNFLIVTIDLSLLSQSAASTHYCIFSYTNSFLSTVILRPKEFLEDSLKENSRLQLSLSYAESQFLN